MRGLLFTFCLDPHQRPASLSWAGVLFSFPWAPVCEGKHSRSASDHITSNNTGHPAVYMGTKISYMTLALPNR